MGMPAARVGDMHVCPMVTVLVPHVGGPILKPGCATVLIGGMPSACVGSTVTCVGPPDTIIKGSATVLIGGLPAARLGDSCAHGGTIVVGCPTVLIGDAGGGAAGGPMQAIVDGVNPSSSVLNCGNIIDAVIARLNGTDPDAAAPAGQDGTFAEIEARHNTSLEWGHSFDDAFNAVENGGEGTTAIVGIDYDNGGSHVVVITNVNGQAVILEGQDWGPDSPREVITTPERANERYNPNGTTDVGYGVVP